MIDYYSIRRVNPYMGVLQVVDAGAVRAYSTDGRSWQARRVYDGEQFWSDTLEPAGVSKQSLQEAINRHPGQPFPRGDRFELWLLRKNSGLPLALLKTCRWAREMSSVQDPAWRPFLPGEAGFNRYQEFSGPRSGSVSGQPCRDQDRIQVEVNYAAKPLAAAQWFERAPDGSGAGKDGLRLSPKMRNRVLPREVFPELLVDEGWDSDTQQSLVKAYHDWNASLLLVHHGLRNPTRKRLEQAVCRFPNRLLDSYPVIPEILDPDGLKIAFVKARLMHSV